jgi:hypothetical protein
MDGRMGRWEERAWERTNANRHKDRAGKKRICKGQRWANRFFPATQRPLRPRPQLALVQQPREPRGIRLRQFVFPLPFPSPFRLLSTPPPLLAGSLLMFVCKQRARSSPSGSTRRTARTCSAGTCSRSTSTCSMSTIWCSMRRRAK